MQWGEEGPPPYGTRGLSQSAPLGSADTLGVSNGPRAGKDPHRSVHSPSPSHSPRSCSGPAAAKLVFLKSVLENLPERATDMRPARRGAGRRHGLPHNKSESLPPVTRHE